MEATDEQSITSFLLGELSEGERQNIEERFFADNSFYDQVLAVQDDLADDYVQSKLPPRERTRFEEYFLQSPRRRERVDFAAAFAGALARPERREAQVILPPRPQWWWALLAFGRGRAVLATSLASMLILVLVGTWFYVQNRHLVNRVAQADWQRDESIRQSQAREAAAKEQSQEMEHDVAALRAQDGELQNRLQQKESEIEALRREKRNVAVQRPEGFVASFMLLPGLTRDSNEPEKLIIPAAARLVQLRLGLEHEEEFEGYLAEIRTARGNLIWSKSGLAVVRTSAEQSVSLTLPNRLLTNGEFEVTLKGIAKGKPTALGYYYFIAFNPVR